MSSTSDPSSIAAQRAQDDPLPSRPDPSGQDDKPRGFFARLFGSDDSQAETDIAQGDVLVATEARHKTNGHVVGLSALRRLRVEDVAIPRAEITAVPADISLKDLVHVFRESGNTRLPVYDDTLDNPLGMVHLKDLSLRHGFNGEAPDFKLTSMLRPLLYAPPSMPIGVLLQKMQTERKHMALVVDEYGGVDGLLTIEDLIEQVVGEIEDEHDVEEDRLWTREASGSYLVFPRAPLAEFEAETGILLSDADADEEIDSMGGLVFVLTGRVPARGEVIPHPSGAEFEVVDADARRIKRLRLRLPKSGEA